MRILITGSRDWVDESTIRLVLARYQATAHSKITLVHGACPSGADEIADRLNDQVFGWPVERHPADWKTHGKRAGYLRNAEMVALGADVCLAFIRNSSRGASMTADLAEKAGIPTRRFTMTDHWLKFDDQRRVTGCQCGFTSDLEQTCGWGDDVVAHLIAVGRGTGPS